MMGVMLPFWTSFLIRVYAWIGILKDDGLLNHTLMAIGMIHSPLRLYHTDIGVYIGMVYSYLPFMVMPLYAHLVKMDLTLLEAAYDLGCKPWTAFTRITLAAVEERHYRRQSAGVHSGGRRVRDSRTARRRRHADDRPRDVG